MKIVIFFSGIGTNLEAIIKQQGDYEYEVIAASPTIQMHMALRFVKNII